MDCQRCGGAVRTFELDGHEALVCEDCGYLGVPVEHRVEPREDETWGEALARFRAERGGATVDDVVESDKGTGTDVAMAPTDDEASDGADTVTCRVCGQRYKVITASHLRTHDMTTEEYREEFGEDVALRPGAE